jgi:hypothetical protein
MYSVYCIQCTKYSVLHTGDCIHTMHYVHSFIYSELFTLFIRILKLTVILIHHICTVHTYLSLELYCKQCMFCILFTLFKWLFIVMHTLALLLLIAYNLQHILCIIQFTAYYNTVTVFICAKRGGTIVPLQYILPVPDTTPRTSEDECKWYYHQMIYFPETITQ